MRGQKKVNAINTGSPLKVGPPNDDTCPRHGSKYVIRRGTNRCPKGRKLGVSCK